MEILKKCCSTKVLVAAIIILCFLNVIRLFWRTQELDAAHKHGVHYNKRAWFFQNGTELSIPTKDNELELFPESYKNLLFFSRKDRSDRILKQLMYLPEYYVKATEGPDKKNIFIFDSRTEWSLENDFNFQQSKCPIKFCQFVTDLDVSIADLLIFRNDADAEKFSDSKQLKMLYHTKSPLHTSPWKADVVFDWTATYRRDSEIVVPFLKWMPYDVGVRSRNQMKNFARHRDKQVVWYLDDCDVTSNHRYSYVLLLKRHIQVDIYGNCGAMTCPQGVEKCFKEFGRHYKFYLAFEDATCHDYIGNSRLLEAFQNNLVPIVMGASKEEYEQLLPYHSFIHVDSFSTPGKLARYLHQLNNDDRLFSLYFGWKGTGEFIDTHFWCRVCAMLHAADHKRIAPKPKTQLTKWWNRDGGCKTGLQVWQKNRTADLSWGLFYFLLAFIVVMCFSLFYRSIIGRIMRNTRNHETDEGHANERKI